MSVDLYISCIRHATTHGHQAFTPWRSILFGRREGKSLPWSVMNHRCWTHIHRFKLTLGHLLRFCGSMLLFVKIEVRGHGRWIKGKPFCLIKERDAMFRRIDIEFNYPSNFPVKILATYRNIAPDDTLGTAHFHQLPLVHVFDALGVVRAANEANAPSRISS